MKGMGIIYDFLIPLLSVQKLKELGTNAGELLSVVKIRH